MGVCFSNPQALQPAPSVASGGGDALGNVQHAPGSAKHDTGLPLAGTAPAAPDQLAPGPDGSKAGGHHIVCLSLTLSAAGLVFLLRQAGTLQVPAQFPLRFPWRGLSGVGGTQLQQLEAMAGLVAAETGLQLR